MGNIEKRKNGLRVCRVEVPDIEQMTKMANELNKAVGKLGEGRLYAQTWYEKPTLVPAHSMTIYQELLEDVIRKSPENPQIESYIAECHKKVYIVLRSRIKATLDYIHQQFHNELGGYPLDLTSYEKSILLTDIGIANILDIEEKYHCKIIANVHQQVLNILTTNDKVKPIKEEVKARVEDHFFYRVSLNTKAFKHFKNKPEQLEELQKQFVLRLVELETDSRALLLEGSALNVQKTFGQLMHIIEGLTVSEEEQLNADVCGVCCE